MNFTEIKGRIKDYCNLSSTDADTRVGISINNHYRRITSSLGMDTSRFVTRTQATTPGQATVTFTAIEKIDRIREVSTGVILTELSLHDQRTTPTTSDPPGTWTTQQAGPDRVIVLLGSASPFVWTLAADGWTTLADLSGVEEPVFPESYHDVLVWWVLAEEFLKKEKLEVAATYAKLAEKVQAELVFQLADSHTRETQQRKTGGGNGHGQGSGGGISPGVPAHAPNHYAGGSDPVNISNLDGYPGDQTQVLRGDGTFAGIPAPGGAGANTEVIFNDGGALAGDARLRFHKSNGITQIETLVVNQATFPGGAIAFTGHNPEPDGVAYGIISINSQPGDDDGLLYLTAASGDPTAARSAAFILSGNQHAPEPGSIHAYLGNIPGAQLKILRSDGTTALTVDGATGITTCLSLGTTPLNADSLASGTVPDARLSVNVLKHAGGYPGGTVNFLRADGTFAPPGAGVAVHAPTHLSGGSDPITVTGLAGYPGGTTTFLRADGTFATPSGGAGAHATTHQPGGADPMAVDAAAATGSLRTLGTSATSACAGNDSRLTNSRTPTAHATTHKSGQPDVIKLDEFGAPTDITTLNATTSAHGLMQKYPGGTTTFLRADGTFATAGGSTTPGGATTQVQFNDAGAFGGDAGLTYTKATDTLTIVGGLTVGGSITATADLGIVRNTTDGADNGYVSLCGGAAALPSRGGSVIVYGNEHGSGAGSITAHLGNAAAAAFYVVRGDGVSAFVVNGTTGVASFAGDIALTGNTMIRRNTVDGVDNGSIQIAGGGDGAQVRGASIAVYGNENSSFGGQTAIYIGNVAGANFQIWRGVGAVALTIDGTTGALTVPSVYNDTLAGTANVIVDASGNIKRATSSKRYKTAITPLDDWRWILDLTPVTFDPLEAPGTRRFGGLLAEDVAEHSPAAYGKPIFAGLDNQGRPDDVAYDHLAAPFVAAIQELTARLVALEERMH